MGENPREPQQNREPLQCWKCGGPHIRRNCPPKNDNVRSTYNIQEAETVGQVARVVPRIYTTLEYLQEDHQSMVVEVAGKIVEQSFSILIDLGYTHSYIAPRVVEVSSLRKAKHNKS